MAGGKLATDVHVWSEQKADFVVLEKGTTVPGWAKDLVTNPKAYAAPVEAEAGTTSTDSDGPKTYDQMSGDELKALLKERELPVGGKKAELVARLTEDDVEKAAEATSLEAGTTSTDSDGDGIDNTKE